MQTDAFFAHTANKCHINVSCNLCALVNAVVSGYSALRKALKKNST